MRAPIIYDSRSMDTQLISINDLSAAEEQAWRALAERAVEPNPFFEPGFLIPASRHFEGYAKTRLLVAHEGSEFRGVLPIIGVERPRIPPRLTMQTHGYPSMVSGLSTPLIDRSCVDETVGALLDALRVGARQHDLPGILSLTRLVEHGPVIGSLRREAGARGMPTLTKESWERGLVQRDGRWESPFSSQRRRTNGRRRRALAADAASEVTVVNRTNDPAAVVDFLTMEASGWKGRGEGSALARQPEKVAWFEEWSGRWTEAGRVLVFALNVGDTSIAMQYCVLGGDGVTLYRIAYDDAYAKYAPGALLIESVLQELLTQTDARWVDSGTDPENSFLLELLPERRTIAMLMIGTGGTVDRTLVSKIPVMTRGVTEFQRTRQRLRDAGRKVRTRRKPGDEKDDDAQSSRVSSATSRVAAPSLVNE